MDALFRCYFFWGGGLGCELLVLLDACDISVLYVVCCVLGDAMSPGVLLTVVGL